MQNADRIKKPLLLIHGADDNNSGTFPLQVLVCPCSVSQWPVYTRFAIMPINALMDCQLCRMLNLLRGHARAWITSYAPTCRVLKPCAVAHRLQSERFYAALKGNGAPCRLVILPHESHGYRARESLMHMAAEMDAWLDSFVAEQQAPAPAEPASAAKL